MNWLIDASAARHSGALTHHLGILPALDEIAGEDRVRVLVSPELDGALRDRLGRLELEVLPTRQGAARLLALNDRVRAAIRAFQPDAVLFGQYAPVRPGAPYVLRMTDAHLVDPAERGRLMRFYTLAQRLTWRAKLLAFRYAVRRAGAVLCATRAVADQLRSAHPELAPGAVHVAPYGLSPLAVGADRHAGATGTRLITMHLSPRKGVEDILDALALPGMEAYELTVLGDLADPKTRYTRFLAGRARSLGVADRVRSVGYVTGRARLRDTLLEHDVLVVPSRIESWSHSVVEGLALGMPVVASDIPCHREVGGDGPWYVPPRAPDRLAEAIRAAASGGAEARRKLEAGLGLARSYRWREYAEAILRSLRAVAR